MIMKNSIMGNDLIQSMREAVAYMKSDSGHARTRRVKILNETETKVALESFYLKSKKIKNNLI